MNDVRELKSSIMYLACSINKTPVRNCKNCPNRDDCNMKEEDQERDLKKVENKFHIDLIVAIISIIWVTVFWLYITGVI
ncbi:hypothetical protein DRN58_05790 [Thermococci archaeon]|nr:MAG: hypothetical protein DRN58_05790 [Thermococci archaeon]